MDYSQLASSERIQKTITSLKANGIEAVLVQNGKDAKEKLFELIPKGSNIMTMTSVTLDTIGATQEIMESGTFNPIKKKLMTMDKNTQGTEMRMLGAGPDVAVGSVHAVSEDGKVLIASATGSQLPAYAYGAGKVFWVVGTQKIVKDFDDGMKRIYEYTFPLENERAKKAYGMGSGVNKLLTINKEVQPGRITLIFVNEVLGF